MRVVHRDISDVGKKLLKLPCIEANCTGQKRKTLDGLAPARV